MARIATPLRPGPRERPDPAVRRVGLDGARFHERGVEVRGVERACRDAVRERVAGAHLGLAVADREVSLNGVASDHREVVLRRAVDHDVANDAREVVDRLHDRNPEDADVAPVVLGAEARSGGAAPREAARAGSDGAPCDDRHVAARLGADSEDSVGPDGQRVEGRWHVAGRRACVGRELRDQVGVVGGREGRAGLEPAVPDPGVDVAADLDEDAPAVADRRLSEQVRSDHAARADRGVPARVRVLRQRDRVAGDDRDVARAVLDHALDRVTHCVDVAPGAEGDVAADRNVDLTGLVLEPAAVADHEAAGRAHGEVAVGERHLAVAAPERGDGARAVEGGAREVDRAVRAGREREQVRAREIGAGHQAHVPDLLAAPAAPVVDESCALAEGDVATRAEGQALSGRGAVAGLRWIGEVDRRARRDRDSLVGLEGDRASPDQTRGAVDRQDGWIEAKASPLEARRGVAAEIASELQAAGDEHLEGARVAGLRAA